MAFLQWVEGIEPGKRFELTLPNAVIGRSSECELPLVNAAAVSRRHAVFSIHEGRHFIEDLKSRNGTLVNDRLIEKRTPLSSGDRITICDQIFRFVDAAAGELGGRHPTQESSLNTLFANRKNDEVDWRGESDDDDGQAPSVMATLDLSGGSTSWRMSAKPEVKLAAMVEISNSLTGSINLGDILPRVLDSLFRVFTQADRGFVIMRPAPTAPLVAVADKHRQPDQEERMRFSRTIVEEAMSTRKAILSADAASDQRFGMAQSIADFQIRSMICAPMVDSAGEPLGVLQIDTMNQRSRFSNDDLEVLAAVAGQAAFAIENARMHERVVAQQAVERDLELASQMQRGLLPRKPPILPGYVFFDYYQSARQVGGDYYDYVTLPDGRVAVVLGDVAGKGVAAALLMARLSSDVRFALATYANPAEAVTAVNASFASHGWDDRFVTMIVAVIDPRDHKMTLVNAGHMAPLLRRSSGEVIEVGEEEAGLPIGVSDDFEFEAFTTAFAPGESLTIFTDGFSEAMNDQRELYGMERLTQQVAAESVSVDELGRHLLDDVSKFVGEFPQSDDMCLACFGRMRE